MMSPVKDNGGGDGEADINDLLQKVKRAFKRKLEIRVSQNLERLGANSFPGSPWEMSLERTLGRGLVSGLDGP